MVLFQYVYRSLLARMRANIVTVLSIALFVAGASVGLAFYLGLYNETVATAPAENIIVLGKGAATEPSSRLDLETARKVVLLDGVKIVGGQPLAARELVSNIYVNTEDYSKTLSVPIRGIDERSLEVHGGRVIEGRALDMGSLEVMIGSRLQRRLPHLKVGTDIHFPGGAGTITGVFAMELGGPAERELWTARSALEAHLKAKNSNSVMVVAASPELVPKLVTQINSSKDMEAQATSLKEYRADKSGLDAVLKVVLAMLVLLSVVAAVAIATTMNAAVALRMPELASLIAVGIRRGVLGRLVIVESLLLAAVGTALGLVIGKLAGGWLEKSGVFRVELASGILVPLVGVGLGLVTGFIGGAFPALSVRRLDVIRHVR
jgi:putative ABC transport system permease protein